MGQALLVTSAGAAHRIAASGAWQTAAGYNLARLRRQVKPLTPAPRVTFSRNGRKEEIAFSPLLPPGREPARG